MILSRLQEFIRFEARWKNSVGANGFITATINEVLRDYTSLEYYPFLKRVNQPVNPAVAGQPNFTIPSLQHFLSDRVFYSDSGLLADAYRLYEGDILDDSTVMLPNRFVRAGNTISVWPIQIGSSAKLFLDYYAFPTELAEKNDAFPAGLIALETTVKMAVIARLSRLSDTDKSSDFKQEEAKAFSRSQGSK